MIKIPTLIYYFILVSVYTIINEYFYLNDWEWWVIIVGIVGARICGQMEKGMK